MPTQFKLLVTTALLFAAACGGPEGLDTAELDQAGDAELEYAQTDSAIGEATCGDFGIADSGRFGRFDYLSPTTYSNPSCYKAVVADTYFYEASRYWGTSVADAGAIPTTEAACESLLLRADLYIKLSTRWARIKTVEARGEWVDPNIVVPPGSIASWRGCHPPSIDFRSDLFEGAHYRITATARTANSSGAPTRPVRIRSIDPIK